MSPASTSAIGTSFIRSWHDNLASEVPGVVLYAPLTNAIYIDHKMVLDKGAVRTFLYSPQIFATFIRGYLQPADFDKILKRPYTDLLKLRNGDWKRFVDAYHDAIFTVSENIGHLNCADIPEAAYADKNQWAGSIDKVISGDTSQFDANAFIESLAMFAGVLYAIPLLRPVAKSVGVLVGKRINETFEALRLRATSDVSPFIIKLVRHYDLSGMRA